MATKIREWPILRERERITFAARLVSFFSLCAVAYRRTRLETAEREKAPDGKRPIVLLLLLLATALLPLNRARRADALDRRHYVLRPFFPPDSRDKCHCFLRDATTTGTGGRLCYFAFFAQNARAATDLAAVVVIIRSFTAIRAGEKWELLDELVDGCLEETAAFWFLPAGDLHWRLSSQTVKLQMYRLDFFLGEKDSQSMFTFYTARVG